MGDEWWRGAVIYQIYPRSFQDSDGDGVGDLRGIARRLPHVAGLGADAVWLSPVFRSPMRDMGYDVSDHRDVDPVFGTLADFDALVAEAHRLGLRVVIDQVLSHASSDHPLFAESRSSRDNPRADWFVWADPRPDGLPPNNWLSIFGGPAWEWDARRCQYFLHNFLPTQPDFNFWHPEVQDWALETLRFWLDRGVDGFRFDTVNYFFHDRRLRDDAADYRIKAGPDANPYHMQYHLFSKNQPENLVFLQRIRGLMDEYGATFTVGEVGEHHHPVQVMGQYTSEGRLHSAYSFELLEHPPSPALIRRTVEGFFGGAPEGWPTWAFSNHDVPRHATRWARALGCEPEAAARLAIAILGCLQGTICLYQGEETGQVQTRLALEELTDPQGIAFWPDDVGRDGCRTPMVWDGAAPQGGFSEGTPWLPVKAEQRARGVAAQERDEGSVLALYRRVLALRRATPALRTGATAFLDLPHPILAFRRGDAVACAYNLSTEPVAFEWDAEGDTALALHAEREGRRVRLGALGALVLA